MRTKDKKKAKKRVLDLRWAKWRATLAAAKAEDMLLEQAREKRLDN